jgi:hypothetical protein
MESKISEANTQIILIGWSGNFLMGIKIYMYIYNYAFGFLTGFFQKNKGSA